MYSKLEDILITIASFKWRALYDLTREFSKILLQDLKACHMEKQLQLSTKVS
jgi:hypothetical protein